VVFKVEERPVMKDGEAEMDHSKMDHGDHKDQGKKKHDH